MGCIVCHQAKKDNNWANFKVQSHGWVKKSNLVRHSTDKDHKAALLHLQTQGCKLTVESRPAGLAKSHNNDESISAHHVMWAITVVDKKCTYS